jgi:hypothetical protein
VKAPAIRPSLSVDWRSRSARRGVHINERRFHGRARRRLSASITAEGKRSSLRVSRLCGRLAGAGGEAGIRVLRAPAAVNPVVQMHRAAAGIARIPGVADDLTCLDAIAWTDITVSAQVCVVVPLEAWAEDPDHLASEVVSANPRDEAARGAQDGRVLRREDVDALVSSPSRARVPPGVNETRRPPRRQGRRQNARGRLRREGVDEPGALDEWPSCGRDGARYDCDNECACEKSHAEISV